ncbi:MAG: hypothetical protein CL608_04115 [Anaerolineaceae bacterium]|nr:hypothetical protein [Anaerolineaceae bacterium]
MTTSIQTIPQTQTLGALLSEYGTNQIRSKGNLWSGITFIILGVIAVVVGLVAAVTEIGSSVVAFCGSVGLLNIAGVGA